MEIYQLKVFLEVAKCLSFTEAANALNLTQPAVSAKIKSLEASLGTDLFHRLGRKIELTAVGCYLQDVGPSLIDLEGRLVQGVEKIKQGSFNRLKIGCMQNIASGWLPRILFDFRQQYSDIEVQCFPFETGGQVQEAIASGDIDLGFVESVIDDVDNVDVVCVDTFQYCLMVASDHRLARREWLSLRDLTTEAWIFPSTSTPDRKVLETRLSELGLSLSDFTNYEIAESPSLMSPFVNQGHYLGFASSFQFQIERRAKLMQAISLQEFPLNFDLLMLQPKKSLNKKSLKHSGVTKGSTSSVQPADKLIRLIRKKTDYSVRKESCSVSSTTQSKKPSIRLKTRSKFGLEVPSSSQATTAQLSDVQAPNVQPSKRQALKRQISAGQTLKKHQRETLAIRIGTQNKTIQTVTAGLIIQRLGLLEHFLPRTGRYQEIDYQICWRDFTSGAPIVEGLQSEQLDIGVLGDYPLLLSGASSEGALAKKTRSKKTRPRKTRLISFVASNPDGAGNTVIVPNRSELKSLDDLRDRVIAVPFASAAHGMITRTLARANLLPDVTLSSIEDLSIHRLTPRNSQADGYAYFAPLHNIASHQGQFRRLLENDGERLPTFHGVVVRESLAVTHPDVVIAYLKALIAAQHWYKTTPSALSLVSNWVGLDAEIVAKTLSDEGSDAIGLFFPDTKIRTDWIEAHIQQLSAIEGNETLGELDLGMWIQSDLLESAIAGL